jgi:DNA transposition AAA+ family ATPase
MLIIDEAQRLKPETFDDARDLGEELGLSVVLVGTDRLDAAIGRDRQVKRRFQACHRFGKLDADDFETTVNLWEAQVLKLPVASNLTQKEVLTKLTAATGGYIAQLDDILREAVIQSLLAGFKRIEIPVLERVIKDYE